MLGKVLPLASIAGSSFIIINTLCFKALRKSNSSRLVMFFSVCSFIHSLVIFFSTLPDLSIALTYEAVCLIQAILLQYFFIAYLLWTSCVSVSLIVVCYFKKNDIRRVERYYHFVCWCVPVIFCVLARTHFGLDKVWCWIAAPDDLFVLLVIIAPTIIIILFNLIAFFFILVRVQKRYSTNLEDTSLIYLMSRQELAKKLVPRLSLYPVILCLCTVTGVYIQTRRYIDTSYEPSFLTQLFYQISLAQGFFNAIVYLFSSKLKHEYRRVIIECSTYKANSYRGSQGLNLQFDDEQ